MPRVIFATCDEFPDLHDDDRPLLDLLRAEGVDVEVAIWGGPRRYGSDDLVVLRSVWDYVPRRDEFVAWARSLPRLLNAAPVVAWNTDKRYLRELGARGVPIIPTTWVEPGAEYRPPAFEHVVKPAISAGAQDSARYAAGDPASSVHVASLGDAGRLVMVQPYLARVDDAGETAMLFFDRQFSHAVRKGPILRRGEPAPGALFAFETISRRDPAADELALGEAVVAALPFARDEVLYARVDVLRSDEGAPLLIEAELTEPSFFFSYAPGARERFVHALIARLA